MAATLLLDRSAWDLCINAGGDIAAAAEPYALEQDVASECRVFAGEAYYNTSIGVPYFTEVLGEPVPVALLKEALTTAASRVPGVTGITVYLTGISGRQLSGQVQFSQGSATL